MLIQRVDAIHEYMRAVIRAREARSIDCWDSHALRGAYMAAINPGISFENWCARMEYELEPAPEHIPAENDAAIEALISESAQGAPISIEQTESENF